jgi:hypothetical protein
VDAHPAGCSPLGVCDVVGNTWELTDEFTDQHSRAVVLKGGSNFYAKGSMWYFPNALRLDQQQKMFLMSPGWERSGTVGFRCVADATPLPTPAPPPPTPAPPPPCAECTGSGGDCLCVAPGASLDPVRADGTIDLSHSSGSGGSELDWVSAVPHEQTIAQKAKGSATAPAITFQLINATAADVVPYCCSPLQVGWSSGGAGSHASQAPTGSGLYVRHKGAGFSLRVPVPATGEALSLTLFAGCWQASCGLRAALESASASASSPRSWSPPLPQARTVKVDKTVLMFRYEIVFRAAESTSGDPLVLVLTWEKDDAGEGNATFEAAVLGRAAA